MTTMFEKPMQGFVQAYEEFQAIANESLEAGLKSMAAATKGFDETARSASDLIQENVNRLMEAGKTMSTAKSLREVMDWQQNFAKDLMDVWMNGTSKISEISARTTKDVIEPVANQTGAAMSRLMQKAKTA